MANQQIKTAYRILNTNIVVDYWMESENDELMRFMTLVRLENTVLLETIRKSNYSFFTSKYNKKLLVDYCQIDADRIVELPMNQSLGLSLPEQPARIGVTLFDANYSLGSLMFLFQGDFGNILYTGLCGPIDSSNKFWRNKEIQRIIREKSLDMIYLDNTYAAQHCDFPTRGEAMKQLIDLLRKHPKEKIFICGVKRLGKEEVIVDVAQTLNEKIFISEEKYKLFTAMFNADYVTTDANESRITMLEGPMHPKECYRICWSNYPCVVILLTAYFQCDRKNEIGYENPNIHIIPYSGHASHSDLMRFVAKLYPRAIKPIIINTSDPCQIIPRCMLQLCYSNDDSVIDSDNFIAVRLDTPEQIETIKTNIPSQQNGRKINPPRQLGKLERAVLINYSSTRKTGMIELEDSFMSDSVEFLEEIFTRTQNKDIVETNENLLKSIKSSIARDQMAITDDISNEINKLTNNDVEKLSEMKNTNENRGKELQNKLENICQYITSPSSSVENNFSECVLAIPENDTAASKCYFLAENLHLESDQIPIIDEERNKMQGSSNYIPGEKSVSDEKECEQKSSSCEIENDSFSLRIESNKENEWENSSSQAKMAEVPVKLKVNCHQSILQQENIEQVPGNTEQVPENMKQVSENMEQELENSCPSHFRNKSEIIPRITSECNQNRKEKNTSKKNRHVKIYPELEVYTLSAPNDIKEEWTTYFLEYMDNRAWEDRMEQQAI